MDDLWSSVTHTFRRLGELPAWKALLGGLLAAGNFLFGDFRPTLSAILVLCCLDILTGLTYAIMRREIESQRLMRGAVKLAIYGNLLMLGHQFHVSGVLVVVGAGLAGLIDGYIMLTEGISVTENLDKIAQRYGIDLPFLGRIICYLRGRRDQLDGDSNDKDNACAGR